MPSTTPGKHAAPRGRRLPRWVAYLLAACIVAGLGLAFWTWPELGGSTFEGTSEPADGGYGVVSGRTDVDVDDVGNGADTDADTAVTLASGQSPSGIAWTGNSTFEGSDALEALEEVIAGYQSRGYVISIVIYDLDGDARLSYQPDARVYSASAIKGPYCMFVCEELLDTGRRGDSTMATVENCIVNSDNDAYRSLRSANMGCGWAEWLEAAGVGMEDGRANGFENHWYADMSAADFCACWPYGYGYLTSDGAHAAALADCFADTLNSPMHVVLGQDYLVWSKAGWYEGGDGLGAATNDCGVVFSDTGPYVLCICTDAPVDFTSLTEAVDACNRCHGELTGGGTDSLITEATEVISY